MKFTLSWLKDHLETDAGAEELAGKMTAIGLEVESLSDPAAALAPFIVARIESAEKHPHADRLKLCKVDTGSAMVAVVCGAPNARTGLKGVFAAPGTVIPASGAALKISGIRGVESRGMLCSARELQLGEDHEGIIELPDDAPVGQSFAAYRGLSDPVFEIRLTPNRPDCFGVRGIARDLAAVGMGRLKPRGANAVTGAFKSPFGIALATDDKTACPYLVGRYFKGLRNGPSPEWLQNRLKAIGQKPISALVDITNYLTIDAARPLHVFDAAKVKGGIRARPAEPGEKILALNGKEYALDPDITVIADHETAHAIAGIMGGMESGCTGTTTEAFLECAYFDPVRTARSGRRLQITSDARTRFERGVDPGFMLEAAGLATKLILDICGGVASELVVAGAPPKVSGAAHLRASRCKTLGGLDVPVLEQKKLLEAIGCTVKDAPGGLDVAFPGWRPDMEGEADCVEEILRLKGYDAIPPVSMPRLQVFAENPFLPAQRRAEAAKRALAARGMLEAVTWSFMPASLAALFGGEGPRLQNPISSDLDVMRKTLLPNLLQAAARNAGRGYPDAALFEAGAVYHGLAPEDQGFCVGGVRAGLARPRHWAEKARAADLFDAKADARAALAAVGAPVAGVQASPGAPGWFHPGRSGVLRLGGAVLGAFGEIHPAILRQLDIRTPACGFELFFDALPSLKETGAARPPVDLPELQPVVRDFAFRMPRDAAAGALVRAVQGASRELIAGVEVFDLYEGEGVPEGSKSLAVEVRIQPRGKSLTEGELEALSEKIIAAASRAAGATLR